MMRSHAGATLASSAMQSPNMAMQQQGAAVNSIEKDPPLITLIGEHLAQHNESLAAWLKRLSLVADRTLGSVPTEARNETAPAPAHCTLARVDAALSDYAAGLRWLQGLVERLERL